MNTKALERLKLRIDKWSNEIDAMEAQVRNVQADARIQYLQAIEALKKRRDLAVQEYEALKEPADLSVSSIRDGVIGAWKEFSKGVESAKNAFRGMM